MLPDRLTALPEYAFPRLHTLLADIPPGKPVIDLSIGSPKHPPPAFVAETLARYADRYRDYPPNDGTESFRAAAKSWAAQRYHLSENWLERDAAVLPLNGTREGMFMAVLATTPERKDGERPVILMPNPFYQCYAAAALAAGAEPVYLSAARETDFLPSLDLPDDLLRRTATFFLCSPSNPQGAVASEAYWRQLLELADRYDFMVFADECYSEIYREQPPAGVLQAAAAISADLNRVMAFHSLSKRSNLAGLRVGFVAGGQRPIAALKRLKSYGGAPVPTPSLYAAEAAWGDEEHVKENRKLYKQKFDISDRLLREIFTSHTPYTSPEAGFFLWLPVGDGEAVAASLWRDEGVKALPGAYFARVDADGVDPGKEFLRIALVDTQERVEEALTRVAAHLSALR